MHHRTSMPTLYDILGVDVAASPAAVRHAWREAAVRTHPDTGGTAASFRAVKAAFTVLADPQARAAYDRSLLPDQPDMDDAWTPPPPSGAAYDPARRPDYASAHQATPEDRPFTGAYDEPAGPRPWQPGYVGPDGSWGSHGSAVPSDPDPTMEGEPASTRRGLVHFLTTAGVLALVLVALVWLSVALRAKGLVPLTTPATSRSLGGTWVLDGPPAFPPLSLGLLLNGWLWCLLPAMGLRWFWRPLSGVGRALVLLGIELVALLGAQLVVGTGWAWIALGSMALVATASRLWTARRAPAAPVPGTAVGVALVP